jgi:2-keto-4-pentenoate hydratase/2-oxohepta-3-ene-1,7-dioic acid hydratase in catechol pathway
MIRHAVKLATFSDEAGIRIGLVEGDEVVDLAAVEPSLPREMSALLAAGDSGLAAVRAAARRAGPRRSLGSVRLLAPIPRPQKFLAVGLNYADHAAEGGREAPKFPVIFNKQVSCVSGPYDPIWRPRASEALDYEGELAFAIGRRCRHVPRGRAREVIAGYLVCNDVSVRDWQARSQTITLGKSWDTHGPLGPWLTTADEVGDPHALELRTWVNGELRQNASTKQLLFDCYALVETLSTVCTLEPGDVVTTGTPAGVAIGFKPPRFLRTGDVVRIEIEKLGRIENRVVDEPADSARP